MNLYYLKVGPLQKDVEKDGGDLKDRMDRLQFELGDVQRMAFEMRIPIVVVFEGLDVWGLAENVNRFVRALDPRGCDIHFTVEPTQPENELPFISRYYNRMPARGRVAVFDRSWYFWLVYDYYRTGDKKRMKRRMEDIRMMERQHVREGWTIIKFFLGVKKKELRRRLKESDPRDPCRGDFPLAGDEFIKDYNDVVELWKDLLKENDIPCSPWHWIDAEDADKASLEIMEKVVEEMGPILQGSLGTCRASLRPTPLQPIGEETVLDKVVLSFLETNDEYKKELDRLQLKLDRLQCDCFKKRIPTVIVFEGWDSAGKGGNILRLTAPLNPRGYRVIPVSAPNDIESTHHHLWRFYRDFPRDGRIAIFDRSWYGKVLVERVEGFSSEEEWSWAYDEIVDMERMLAEHGTALVKFWLHIDKEEQLRRFQERESDQHKHWKINAEDYRNREKWDLYVPAVEEMIARTSTKKAPWVVVPSNDKRFSRLFVLRKVIESMEERLKER
jgi:polyphosphate:AMP phosphotransferase